MGDGIAILPHGNEIVAPCDCKVIMISETKHALGLETADGMQMILHIGIDTVKRNGQGFKVYCDNEALVKTGDLLIEFERENLEEEGFDTTVLLVFVDDKKFTFQSMKKEGDVTGGKSIVTKYS